MKINEIIAEGFSNGKWNGDPNAFSAKLVHETTPQAAEQIRLHGFKGNPEGIFFNMAGTGYSGGGYGGVYITCRVSGPAEGVLDLSSESDDDFGDFEDGHEIAAYAKKRGYWAWKDDLQMAVLNPAHIQFLGISK